MIIKHCDPTSMIPFKKPAKSIHMRQSETAILYMKIIMKHFYCLEIREVNFGKAVDDDPENISATAKNAQEELKFLMTLAQAFESHPKVDGFFDEIKTSV